MPTEIYLVKVGMTMTEGMVAEWYVDDGAEVQAGEPLYALETEKVNMDVEAETSGIVKQVVSTGIMMEPGEVVGYIFAPGEKIPDDMGGLQEAPAPSEEMTPTTVSSPEPIRRQTGDRVFASPAARRLARELDVDYTRLSGSGPGGRIVEADVQAAASGAVIAGAEPPKASPAARRAARELEIELRAVEGTGPGGRIVKEDVETFAATVSEKATDSRSVPMTGMRRTVARRMHESLQNTAQLTMNMEVAMDEAVKMREQLIDEWQAHEIRPTYTDIVIRAVARALVDHPLMNGEFHEDEIILHEDVHIGVAVSLEEGLVVPVIRHASGMSLKDISVESARLAQAARSGSLGLDDYAGGTFTVTALGMYGVDSFTPILNEPQAGILGVNRIYDGVVWQDERPLKSKRMNLSLTWDHRVLDGVPAAEFLSEVRDLLQAPYRLLV